MLPKIGSDLSVFNICWEATEWREENPQISKKNEFFLEKKVLRRNVYNK